MLSNTACVSHVWCDLHRTRWRLSPVLVVVRALCKQTTVTGEVRGHVLHDVILGPSGKHTKERPTVGALTCVTCSVENRAREQ